MISPMSGLLGNNITGKILRPPPPSNMQPAAGGALLGQPAMSAQAAPTVTGSALPAQQAPQTGLIGSEQALLGGQFGNEMALQGGLNQSTNTINQGVAQGAETLYGGVNQSNQMLNNGLMGATGSILGGASGAVNAMGQGYQGAASALSGINPSYNAAQMQAINMGQVPQINGVNVAGQPNVNAQYMQNPQNISAQYLQNQPSVNAVSNGFAANTTVGSNITDPLNQGAANFQGFLGGGQNAAKLQADLTGANGQAAQQSAYAAYQSSPAMQYQMDQMQRATERSAAARGGALGGNVLMELQRNASGIASQDYQNQFNNMNTVANPVCNPVLWLAN